MGKDKWSQYANPRVCPPGFCPSELRFDLVSNDWVVIATVRARKPEGFKKDKRRTVYLSKKTCPFDNISTQETPSLIFYKNKKLPLGRGIPKDWTTIVVPNKYPAFTPGDIIEKTEGPHRKIGGIGFHEVIVTRDHKKHFALLPQNHIKEIIDVYQDRYLKFMEEKFVNYISIFHNYGVEAGASVAHPHSQLIAIPLTSPDVKRSLDGSKLYWNRHKKCVHCVMLDWDRVNKKRIVFENKEFIVVCPFASRVAFDLRIYPKKHRAYFERTNETEKKYLAEAFHAALCGLYKGLGDPAYNFFLHTAPSDGKNYDHYHWHWEIIPKTATWAGFELGTGIEISTIEPERAAEYLRKQ